MNLFEQSALYLQFVAGGQEPQLQPLFKLLVDCKIVYPTVTNRISMFTQKLQRLSLLFMNQIFVLNKDRERSMFSEIQGLQNLVIMPALQRPLGGKCTP